MPADGHLPAHTFAEAAGFTTARTQGGVGRFGADFGCPASPGALGIPRMTGKAGEKPSSGSLVDVGRGPGGTARAGSRLCEGRRLGSTRGDSGRPCLRVELGEGDEPGVLGATVAAVGDVGLGPVAGFPPEGLVMNTVAATPAAAIVAAVALAAAEWRSDAFTARTEMPRPMVAAAAPPPL